MKIFVFDSKRCNGCHNCQVACKDEHAGNDWIPYAKSQPNTGHFWLKMQQIEHGQIPYVSVEYTPWFCMHCESCIASDCCTESAFIRRSDGLIYIDPEACSGCGACVNACPYDAVFFNEGARIAQKCTGCSHLVEKGELPHCVDLCAMDALRFGEYEDFIDEIRDAEVMLPELGTNPHVYYLNRPHLFICGEVWDPVENEVIEGATVELVLPDGDKREQLTDDFGDFRFVNLMAGNYGLSITAEGYASVHLPMIELQKSISLGDFPLDR